MCVCVPQMEVERALLEGEQESEIAQLHQDKDALEQLNDKMVDMEKKLQAEKSQVIESYRQQQSHPFRCLKGNCTSGMDIRDACVK